MFAKNTDNPPEKKKESFSESVSGIAAVFVSGLFIITFIVQAFEIPSGSMENTLLVGDHVFVDRLAPMKKAALIGPVMPYREIRRGRHHRVSPPERTWNVRGQTHPRRARGPYPPEDGVVYRNGEALKSLIFMHITGPPALIATISGRAFRAALDEVTSEWPMVMGAHIRNGDLVVLRTATSAWATIVT